MLPRQYLFQSVSYLKVDSDWDIFLNKALHPFYLTPCSIEVTIEFIHSLQLLLRNIFIEFLIHFRHLHLLVPLCDLVCSTVQLFYSFVYNSNLVQSFEKFQIHLMEELRVLSHLKTWVSYSVCHGFYCIISVFLSFFSYFCLALSKFSKLNHLLI